ncbi:MAG TPA: TlpA disulfide reductase family protein [Pyrinomonadaceae bacterium]|nr:TlpA disulfide reductase family protein [Pyrinomonadaceae bacterium]
MIKKALAFILLFIGPSLAAPPGVRAQQQAAQAPAEVSFKLKGIDGKTYDLTSMRGSVLLVSFGASWCQPCLAELRALEELKQEFKEQPVKILWVSIEPEEDISDGKLRSFAKSLDISFPVLRDPSSSVYAQFSTRRRIPLVVFINREGKLVMPQHAGMAEPELYKRTMRERLNKLLQTEAPPAVVSGSN